MIEELTKKQESLLSVYAEKWIKIGLQTGKADRAKAEAAILDAYTKAGFAHPKLGFEWHDGPTAGAKRVAELVGCTARDALYSACYGAHDAGWLSFYDYTYEVLGKADSSVAEAASDVLPLIEASKEVGWFWCLDELCVVTERPYICLTDEQGRLDCRTGPAIAYADGTKVYSVGGTVVPEFVVESRATNTVKEVEAIENLEVRRVAIELMGIARYIKGANFEVVDQDTDKSGNKRSLLKRGDMLFCHVVNSTKDADGTAREYFIRVEKHLRPLRSLTDKGEPQRPTCHNAIASGAGERGEDFELVQES